MPAELRCLGAACVYIFASWQFYFPWRTV